MKADGAKLCRSTGNQSLGVTNSSPLDSDHHHIGIWLPWTEQTRRCDKSLGNNSAPFGVAVAPDGSKVYVTNNLSNTLSVIRT